MYRPGDKFVLVDHFDNVVKKGNVRRLRDDEYERKNSWPYGVYHYHVDFDDGSYETYQNEAYMKPFVQPLIQPPKQIQKEIPPKYRVIEGSYIIKTPGLSGFAPKPIIGELPPGIAITTYNPIPEPIQIPPCYRCGGLVKKNICVDCNFNATKHFKNCKVCTYFNNANVMACEMCLAPL